MMLLKRLSLLTLSLSLVACGEIPVPAQVPVQSSQSSTNNTNTNIRVHDGDTININNQAWRLRCIDAPELKQPLGKEAQQFLNQTIINEGVVMRDVSPHTTYGRSLGTPYTNSNKNISLMLLENGYAYVEPRYTDCPNMQAYYNAQSTAQNNKVGVWGLDNPTKPWDFRHHHTSHRTHS